MKIFSLKTKKHVVGWSVVMGSITGFSINRYVGFETAFYCSFPGHELAICRFTGWPFKIAFSAQVFDEKAYLLNFLFWSSLSFLTVLLVLSLVRWGKYRNQNSFAAADKSQN
ncbi:MAG: hypothetical protein HY397_00340 [Candidatus Doudnabacteria bacterium]|nr:hypothetical protein [Candidatus Doudnabacteria bacterium]